MFQTYSQRNLTSVSIPLTPFCPPCSMSLIILLMIALSVYSFKPALQLVLDSLF